MKTRTYAAFVLALASVGCAVNQNERKAAVVTEYDLQECQAEAKIAGRVMALREAGVARSDIETKYVENYAPNMAVTSLKNNPTISGLIGAFYGMKEFTPRGGQAFAYFSCVTMKSGVRSEASFVALHDAAVACDRNGNGDGAAIDQCIDAVAAEQINRNVRANR